MTGEQELALAFETHRPRLLRVACATLGSLAEAEDCVQEAWLRDESVSMTLLVVLERLSPAERTAFFLLHDVFGLTFEDVAGVAVRQLAARARPAR